MKQAVRALGWATSIFWIMLLLFTVTAVYSAFQIKPSFGKPSTSTSGDTLTFSLPFILFNGGFYDISKFNVTTLISDDRSSIISQNSTFVPTIPRGVNTSITHNMSIDIGQLATTDLSHLLFNDSALNVAAVLKLIYANAFPFEVSTNFTMPWGAPLANLRLGSLSFMGGSVFMPLSFENHSYLAMTGTVRLELVDDTGLVVGEGESEFNAPPDGRFDTDLEVFLSGGAVNPRARLHFSTPFFSYGPVVISLV